MLLTAVPYAASCPSFQALLSTSILSLSFLGMSMTALSQTRVLLSYVWSVLTNYDFFFFSPVLAPGQPGHGVVLAWGFSSCKGTGALVRGVLLCCIGVLGVGRLSAGLYVAGFRPENGGEGALRGLLCKASFSAGSRGGVGLLLSWGKD